MSEEEVPQENATARLRSAGRDGATEAAKTSGHVNAEAELDDDDAEFDDEDEGSDDEASDDEAGDGAAASSTANADDQKGDGRRRRRRGPPAEVEGDERARAALDFVAKVVREMGMECRVRLKRAQEASSPEEIYLDITGKDAGRIIGKKGQVLQALQFLTHRVVNRPDLERRHVLVDAEGYRGRRDDSLATMAQRLGKQAVNEGKIITFEPMNPRDRRVVHLALAKFEGVVTKSDGVGDDRRVQIIPVRR